MFLPRFSHLYLQRINVVLTRAQSLLIIIGDPDTLYTDENWRYLLKVCHLNSSFLQAPEKKFIFPEITGKFMDEADK